MPLSSTICSLSARHGLPSLLSAVASAAPSVGLLASSFSAVSGVDDSAASGFGASASAAADAASPAASVGTTGRLHASVPLHAVRWKGAADHWPDSHFHARPSRPGLSACGAAEAPVSGLLGAAVEAGDGAAEGLRVPEGLIGLPPGPRYLPEVLVAAEPDACGEGGGDGAEGDGRGGARPSMSSAYSCKISRWRGESDLDVHRVSRLA